MAAAVISTVWIVYCIQVGDFHTSLWAGVLYVGSMLVTTGVLADALHRLRNNNIDSYQRLSTDRAVLLLISFFVFDLVGVLFFLAIEIYNLKLKFGVETTTLLCMIGSALGLIYILFGIVSMQAQHQNNNLVSSASDYDTLMSSAVQQAESDAHSSFNLMSH